MLGTAEVEIVVHWLSTYSLIVRITVVIMLVEWKNMANIVSRPVASAC